MVNFNGQHFLVFVIALTLMMGVGSGTSWAKSQPPTTSSSILTTSSNTDEEKFSHATEILQRLGNGLNSGNGDVVAMNEACGIFASMGDAQLQGLWKPSGSSSELVQTPFERAIGWMKESASNRLSMNQACSSLMSGSTGAGLGNLSLSIKDAGINALMTNGLRIAQESGLPYLTRVELEGSITGGDPNFSLMTIQPWLEDHEDGHFVFNQISWQHGNGDTDDGDADDTLNLGVSYRHLLMEDTLLVGGNIFFDHQMDQNHNRVSLGVDAQTSLYGIGINHYIPLTDWKVVNEETEAKALGGWDLELSGRLPEAPNWTGFIRGFTWDSLEGKADIYGVDAKVEWSPIPALVFVGGVIDENGKSPDVQAAIRLRYNFNKPLEAQFNLNQGLQPVSDKIWDKVRRENTIRTQVRLRAETQLTVLQTIGANTVSSPQGNQSLSSGLVIAMPATITVANSVGAVARIRLYDGGFLTIGQNSQVRIEKGLVTLLSGTMQYVSGSTNVLVNVPGGTITLLGTDIDVVSNGTSSSVRVRGGSVAFAGAASGSATLAVGQMATSTAGAVSTTAAGTTAYDTHTDTINRAIEWVATVLNGTKVAPYPSSSPHLISGGQIVGSVVVIGQKYNVPVSVSGGTPRLELTINGNARVAPLTGGSGSSELEFSYVIQAGDVGATTLLVDDLDLNGATLIGDGKTAISTIADTTLNLPSGGSDVTPPTGYAVNFVPVAINDGNENSVSFNITTAEIGATYDYTISSSGGGTDVTGTGVVGATTENVTGVDLSGLGVGTLTLSLTLTDTSANVGTAVTDTIERVAHNLVAWYRFDETSGTTALDSSGNGNNGTLNNFSGTPHVAGQVGNSLNFDGSNDQVLVPANAQLNNMRPLTVCAWVNPDSYTDTFPIIVDKTDSTGWIGWNFYLSQNMPNGFGLYTIDGAYSEAYNNTFVGQWSFVCSTWDGSASTAGISLYHNGASIAGQVVGTASSPANDSGNNMSIGIMNSGGSAFDGRIDEVRIYDRVLTATEIQALYTADGGT